MSFGDEVPEGSTYEDGLLVGVERGHVLALRTEARLNAKISAVRAMAREAAIALSEALEKIPVEHRAKFVPAVQAIGSVARKEPV